MIDTKSNIESGNIQRRFYADNNSLTNLSSKSDDIESLKTVAKEFEAIFLQMAIKSMRDAVKSMKSELTSDNATDTYQDMYDNQLSMQLSGSSRLGIADAIVRQFSQNFSIDTNATNPAATNTSVNKDLLDNDPKHIPKSENISAAKGANEESKDLDEFAPIEFVKKVWGSVKEVAKDAELDPKMILAQAVHETGWGKFIPKFKSGAMANNIFGIKADSGWDGKSTVNKTFEVENGIVKSERAKFRAYESLTEGVKDYVDFVQSNPRYQKAISANSGPEYIQELHKAGYATDPKYSDKVMSIYNGDRLNNLVSMLNR